VRQLTCALFRMIHCCGLCSRGFSLDQERPVVTACISGARYHDLGGSVVKEGLGPSTYILCGLFPLTSASFHRAGSQSGEQEVGLSPVIWRTKGGWQSSQGGASSVLPPGFQACRRLGRVKEDPGVRTGKGRQGISSSCLGFL
jgi:hypothetical protein